MYYSSISNAGTWSVSICCSTACRLSSSTWTRTSNIEQGMWNTNSILCDPFYFAYFGPNLRIREVVFSSFSLILSLLSNCSQFRLRNCVTFSVCHKCRKWTRQQWGKKATENCLLYVSISWCHCGIVLQK